MHLHNGMHDVAIALEHNQNGKYSPESGRDRSPKVGVFGLRSLSENNYCTILRLIVDSNLKICVCVCAIKELHAIVYAVIYYDFRIALCRLSV